MSYFLSGQNLELDKQYEIVGDEAMHILFARRVKVGERIKLQGPDENRFLAEVVSFTKKSIIIKPHAPIIPPAEPSLSIILFQALIAENALDSILQKSTELGVSRVVLFNAHNTPTHLSEKIDKKMSRWERIIQEAAKQCDRVRGPKIEFLDDAAQIVSEILDVDRVFLLEAKADKSFRDLAGQNYQSLGLITGPEGAFTPDEKEHFNSLKNVEQVRLGPRILRADTAAISAITIAQSLWGDM